jgi:hypothetical protein
MEVTMKKTLLFAGLLLVVTASAAMAAGISVNWGTACWGDAPVSNLTWACNANNYTGIRMTASFKPAETKTTFVATDLYMEGMVEGASAPDWWQLGTGGCRAGQVGLINTLGSATDCQEIWSLSPSGSGFGGIGLYSTDADRLHINAVWAIGDPVEATAETEIFAATFTVGTSKTVGGACAGCSTGACWALNYIQVGYFGETTATVLDQPYVGGNQVLTWQSSSLNCSIVPARNTTWGQIKSLYR